MCQVNFFKSFVDFTNSQFDFAKAIIIFKEVNYQEFIFIEIFSVSDAAVYLIINFLKIKGAKICMDSLIGF